MVETPQSIKEKIINEIWDKTFLHNISLYAGRLSEGHDLKFSIEKAIDLAYSAGQPSSFCPECGFPFEWTRVPVIMDSNELSMASYFVNECETCGHQSDGSTIEKIQPLLEKERELGYKAGYEAGLNESFQAEKDKITRSLQDLEESSKPYVDEGNHYIDLNTVKLIEVHGKIKKLLAQITDNSPKDNSPQVVLSESNPEDNIASFDTIANHKEADRMPSVTMAEASPTQNICTCGHDKSEHDEDGNCHGVYTQYEEDNYWDDPCGCQQFTPQTSPKTPKAKEGGE